MYMQIKKRQFLSVEKLGILIITGIALGNIFVFLDNALLSQKKVTKDQSERITEIQKAPTHLHSKNIVHCTSVCYKPPERPKPVAAVKKRVAVNQPGTTRLADIPSKPKNPNAIRISLAEAPIILSEVKMVNGKGTCIKKNDKGHKSKKFSKSHIDQQCCLDPDEIPNPRCLYL